MNQINGLTDEKEYRVKGPINTILYIYQWTYGFLNYFALYIS